MGAGLIIPFESALDALAQGIFLIGNNGAIQWANAAAACILGYANQNEMLGQSPYDLIHSAVPDGKVFHESMCPICSSNHQASSPSEGRLESFMMKDATQVRVNARVAPWFDKGRSVGKVVSFTAYHRRESLDTLHTLFDHAPVPIALLFGKHYQFQYANTAYRNMFLQGANPEGSTVLQMLPEAGDQGFIEILDRVFESGERYVGNEARLDQGGVDSGQRTYHFNFLYEPISNTSDVVESIFVLVADVTDAVVAREEIKRRKDALKIALQNGRMGAWRADIATGVLTADDTFREFHNAQDEEDLQDAISRIGHPEDQETVRANLDRTISEGVPYDTEYRILNRDGHVRWIAARGSPVYDAHGTMIAVAGVAFDIQAKKAADLVIANSQRRDAFLLRLDETLRQIRDVDEIQFAAMCLLGEELKVSRAYYWEFDKNSGQATIGRHYIAPTIQSLSGKFDMSDLPSYLDGLRAGPLTLADVATARQLSNSEREIFLSLQIAAQISIPVLQNGALVASISIDKNQPHQWSEEDLVLVQATAARTGDAVQRARAEEALRQSDGRKDEFLAMLAHELRNPLAPIGAAAELLQLVKLDEGRLRQTSQIISRQVKHMTSLVDDLLDVSRVTQGLVELDNATLSVSQIVADAIEQVNPLIRMRHHRLTLELTPEATLVKGDQKRLVQVLANLLNNAAKYTHEGGNIHVRTDMQDAHVLIEVSDDGIGMSPELTTRAFDLFAQAERTSDRSSGGLGLGLSLVKSLVELHHGTVTIESAGLGKGSKFTITIPRLVEQGQHGPVGYSELKQQKHTQRLRVLVVDDNVDAASMLAMLLEASGHEVLVEHSARQALERSRRIAPQVCLLDIGLPDMDGNELAQQIRAQPETAKAVLIAITGYGQKKDREQTLAAGFDHHLVKPIDTRELAVILAAISHS